MNSLLHPPAVIAGSGSRLPTSRAEAALLAVIRQRIEGQAGAATGRVTWDRDERCAEREDLRAKLGLSRSALDQLPSGQTLHARIAANGWLRRPPVGIALVVTASWADLARGGEGTVSVAEAIEIYESQRAAWTLQYGSAPFYAAVAGRLTEPRPQFACPGLALIGWEGESWRLCPSGGEASALESLFYPLPPEECAAAIEAHLDAGTGLPRLVAAVAAELNLPLAVVLAAGEKNLRRHALEYRSGHPLFFRT